MHPTERTLVNVTHGHNVMQGLWLNLIKPTLAGGERVRVAVNGEKRTSAQNNHLWSVLGVLSKQVDWYGEKLTAAEWKIVLTAALKKQRAVPGIEGGLVLLGESTSQMSRSQMGELLEFAYAFGAQQNVRFPVFVEEV